MSRANNRRRSDRISISIPIQVSGMDLSGLNFVEQARTTFISRHGGTIILPYFLGPEQTIFIRCASTGKETEARVVGQLGVQLDSHIYGVALLDENVDLWGVRFPDLKEEDKAAGRVLLQCISCGGREVCYLTGVELDIFEANRNLGRNCSQCGEWTLWKQVSEDVSEKQAMGSETQSQPRPPETQTTTGSPVAPPQNRRRWSRTKVRKTGCVRQPASSPDIVQVLDMSRGGICFESRRDYRKGSWVEIAVPYLGGGAAEIFVPARIVRIMARQDEKKEYGVEYVR